MKSIHNFTNTDKALLLHSLFIEEIPFLIALIEKMGSETIEHRETHNKSWNNGLMPFSYWLSLIVEVQKLASKRKKSIIRNAASFSQLFEGMLAAYTNHCVITYAEKGLYKNPKFRLAVELLFMPPPDRKSPTKEQPEQTP